VAGALLVVVGGLPGTGKTTIADELAVQLACPVFNKDRIEASLWRDGVTAEQDSWSVAEHLLTTLASEQVRRGQSAILDTVARRSESRAAWRAIALETGAEFRLIECVCSDRGLHRARIEGRRRGIPGWYELSWDDVETVRARSEPWGDERLVLDAVNPVRANVADVLRSLGRAAPRSPAGTAPAAPSGRPR
jgi:predicted kinase